MPPITRSSSVAGPAASEAIRRQPSPLLGKEIITKPSSSLHKFGARAAAYYKQTRDVATQSQRARMVLRFLEAVQDAGRPDIVQAVLDVDPALTWCTAAAGAVPCVADIEDQWMPSWEIQKPEAFKRWVMMNLTRWVRQGPLPATGGADVVGQQASAAAEARVAAPPDALPTSPSAPDRSVSIPGGPAGNVPLPGPSVEPDVSTWKPARQQDHPQPRASTPDLLRADRPAATVGEIKQSMDELVLYRDNSAAPSVLASPSPPGSMNPMPGPLGPGTRSVTPPRTTTSSKTKVEPSPSLVSGLALEGSGSARPTTFGEDPRAALRTPLGRGQKQRLGESGYGGGHGKRNSARSGGALGATAGEGQDAAGLDGEWYQWYRERHNARVRRERDLGRRPPAN